jgi:RNA polymerase sigma-70 factor, ECF subfamily
VDVARFVTALGPAAARLPAEAEIASLLAAAVARARATLSGFTVDDDALLVAVGDKLAADDWTVLSDALDALDVGELALACACERGDAAALAQFEARYFPVIDLALGPMKLPVGTADEVRQLVRTKLFVGSPDPSGSGVIDPPKVRSYAGRGTLEGLVRVVAVRTALTLQRQQQRNVPLDSTSVAEEILATSIAPELQLVKQRYRHEFKAAFEHAIEELSPRDRMLLKLHVLERSTIDEIGALYRVHRATAARWLEAIRDRLGDRTRELLGEKLDLGSTELESVVRVVQSQVSLSMSRLLDPE